MIVNPDSEKVNLEHILPQTYNLISWGHIPPINIRAWSSGSEIWHY